jgi:hypothetical protein
VKDKNHSSYTVYFLKRNKQDNARPDPDGAYYEDAEEALTDAFLERVRVCNPTHRVAHEKIAFPEDGTHQLVLGEVLPEPGMTTSDGLAGRKLLDKAPEDIVGPGGYHIQWGFDVGTGHGEGGYDAWETRIPSSDPAYPVHKKGSSGRGGLARYTYAANGRDSDGELMRPNDNVILKGKESRGVEIVMGTRGLHQIHAKYSDANQKNGPPYFVRGEDGKGLEDIGGEHGYLPFSRLFGETSKNANKTTSRRVSGRQLDLVRKETNRLDGLNVSGDGLFQEDAGDQAPVEGEDEEEDEEEDEDFWEEFWEEEITPVNAVATGAPATKTPRPGGEVRGGTSKKSKPSSKRPSSSVEDGVSKRQTTEVKRGDHAHHYTPVFGIIQDYDGRAIALRESMKTWTKFTEKFPMYTLYKDKYEFEGDVLVQSEMVLLTDLRTGEKKKIR